MKYYFINYKIMGFNVLLIIDLKVTSVINSSILLLIICPLVLLVYYMEYVYDKDLHWVQLLFLLYVNDISRVLPCR